MKAKILLTNDDGIGSPGLKAAAMALLPLGELMIMAPTRQQTSMGRAYAGDPEARLEPVPFEVDGTAITAYACDASPAAVLRHGLLVFPDYAPSLVVAGVNYGENIGVDASGSGTVGATLDAACRGFPALAMSLETGIESHHAYSDKNWDGAVHFTRLFARGILAKGLPPGVDILKVEVPDNATEKTPWKVAGLSPYSYYTKELPRPGLEARRKEMEIGKRLCSEDAPGTDAYELSVARVVAVTPLVVDFTARISFDAVRGWLETS